ncbi:MAG TPA: tail fiber protein [Bryobacteraceae bacterium]|jgi:microcystin-dependent protein|nr:tail fiber protein [Bryobacteraceae bacterium]
MADPYIGQIMMFAGNFAIRGWALCNGQTMSIQQNSALFSLVGTYYGGNGQTTFNLPDLRSRVPIHQGQGTGLSNYTIGQSGASENVSLTVNQMPAHNHLVNANSGGNVKTPSNNYPGNENIPIGIYSASTSVTMNPATLSTAGGNQPFTVVQPYLCITFLIALQGIFPSRN